MILRPIVRHSPESSQALEPAWSVIARSQSAAASQYLLISQPDHARLSGEFARNFECSLFPAIDDSIARSIGAHDDGWVAFEFERKLRGDPPLSGDGRPQHFLQVTVDQSLTAWAGSIKSAGEVCKLGEYLVSTHFSRIGRMRIQMNIDAGEDLSRLEAFVRVQEDLLARLSREVGLAQEQLNEYLDLLQFCDLLSLYICCGSTDAVEFPQQFKGKQIRIRYEDGVYHAAPNVFGGTPRRFSIPVRLFPSADGEGHTRIGFHVK